MSFNSTHKRNPVWIPDGSQFIVTGNSDKAHDLIYMLCEDLHRDHKIYLQTDSRYPILGSSNVVPVKGFVLDEMNILYVAPTALEDKLSRLNWRIDAILTVDTEMLTLPHTIELPVYGVGNAVTEPLTISQQSLVSTDWQVIRELERMFLKGTPLNQEREITRAFVDRDLERGGEI